MDFHAAPGLSPRPDPRCRSLSSNRKSLPAKSAEIPPKLCQVSRVCRGFRQQPPRGPPRPPVPARSPFPSHPLPPPAPQRPHAAPARPEPPRGMRGSHPALSWAGEGEGWGEGSGRGTAGTLCRRCPGGRGGAAVGAAPLPGGASGWGPFAPGRGRVWPLFSQAAPCTGSFPPARAEPLVGPGQAGCLPPAMVQAVVGAGSRDSTAPSHRCRCGAGCPGEPPGRGGGAGLQLRPGCGSPGGPAASSPARPGGRAPWIPGHVLRDVILRIRKRVGR